MKPVIKISAILALLAGLWWGFLSPREDSTDMESSSKDGVPGAVEQNVTAFSIEGRSPKGARQWNLQGDSARIIEDDIYLDNLIATAFGDEATIDLLSDAGIYRRNAGEVELIGNVRVSSGEDFSLFTESARWSQENKEIRTEDHVRIIREGMTATGTGGIANSEERWARLYKDVKVFIEPGTTVISDGPLEVRHEDNTAIFRDNVMVQDEEGHLFADKLTVEVDPETRKLAKVTAEGNVKVKKGNTYTLSEKAVYTENTKSAELFGRPRVIIDPDELAQLENFRL